MTSEELEGDVKRIQNQYQNLNLTFEQAEKIYRFERSKAIYSDKHYFSQWEEWDYESTTFREILNDEQYVEYEKLISTAILLFEQSLKDQDQETSNEIAFWKDQIEFYESHFIVNFFREPYLLFHGWFSSERPKISYLKTEYARFLNESKKELLTNHFRFNRKLTPTALKISLLRHDSTRILPNFLAFKQWMDEPTKAISDHLAARFRSLPTETKILLDQKFEDLKAFIEANTKKHFGHISGWNSKESPLSSNEEKEYRQMTWLLVDKNKYAE